ncbi:hypothetical protein AB0M83_20540 [Amycolatopsis sp. NPDC051106]|uniref:hypothetical protein n=1 Tax=unclassified Amycolatopsis TaxID=2618356 RepID=UPI0034171C2D
MNEIGKFLAENPMAAVIAAGEIGFWVFIVAGLAVRYALHARRASAVLLAMVPVVDVVVLVATVIDLAGGAKANFTHGLAAVYLGFSVVFGPSMVRWADARFAHRFAGGPPPPPKRYGREKLRHEWREFGKCVLACGLAALALLVAIHAIGTPEQVAPLWGWFPRLGVLAAIWLATGPVWEGLFGKREPAREVRR